MTIMVFEIQNVKSPEEPTGEEIARLKSLFKLLIKRIKTFLWELTERKPRRWADEYALAMEIYEAVKDDPKRWSVLDDATDNRLIEWLIPVPLALAGEGLVQEGARMSLAWAEIAEAENFLPDRAFLLAQAGLESEAREQVQTNILRFPNHAWVHIKSGDALYELKDPSGAEAYFRRGLDLADEDYDRAGALDRLIPFLRETGRVSEAVDLEAAEQKRRGEDDESDGDDDVDMAQLPGSFDDEPVARSAEKVGRNDPCPCGSGKKYKKCHLDAPVSAAGTDTLREPTGRKT